MLSELRLELEISQEKLEKLKFDKSLLDDSIEKELEKIDFLRNKINCLYEKFKRFNKRDQQIYIEKVVYKWSNDKISINHYGISRHQIRRIVEKIERSFQN